jgi:peptide chain release factor 1
MFEERIQGLSEQLKKLEDQLSDPKIIGQQDTYRELAREHARTRDALSLHERYTKVLKEIEDSQHLLQESENDEDLQKLAEQELRTLEKDKKLLEGKLQDYFIPRDKNDSRNIIMEIRAGTGGEEAALFVADLFRMYSKYAEKLGWKVEALDSNPTGIGGFKEIILSISGNEVFKRMKYESGVHRVQRIPVTEGSGRVHTSATTVAVLPEAEEVEIKIDPGDIRVDVFRSSGPGGQSVNTTDSAVRVTHLPTGIVVSCQDEKSQHKNKVRAMRVLRARLKELMELERAEEISTLRRSQICSGDRSEKIRTYNYPQNRVTDHRIGLSIHNLEDIMEGGLEELTEALLAEDREKLLKKIDTGE